MHFFNIMAVTVYAATLSGSVFEPDRAMLFRSCATMKKYASVPNGPAVETKGSWIFTPARQRGAAIILDAWQRHGDANPDHLAYVLATARRESAESFIPIAEAPACGRDEGCRERAIGRMQRDRTERTNAERAKTGKPPIALPRNYALPDAAGRRWYGRGYNQLTHADDYAATGRRVGVDLAADPDAILDPKLSARILIQGMLEGWYGSRKPLSFYLNDTKRDWINARDTTNPRSPNKAITAAYAKDFRKCLHRSGTA